METWRLRFTYCARMGLIASVAALGQASSKANPVLEWNQIFIDTLIATNTANSSSQRLGAIVHTAIFDAYNGIERRYTPLFVRDSAPRGASRRAAVIAAGYTALVGLFPTQKPALDAKYASFFSSAPGKVSGSIAGTTQSLHKSYESRH